MVSLRHAPSGRARAPSRIEALAPEMLYGRENVLESLPPVSAESLHNKSKPLRAEGMECVHGANTCCTITAPSANRYPP
jgi:hypothetical protein